MIGIADRFFLGVTRGVSTFELGVSFFHADSAMSVLSGGVGRLEQEEVSWPYKRTGCVGGY